MEKAKLFKEDERLFAEMAGKYISESEKQFFEEMHYKQIYKPVGCVDVIMDESSNEDNVYIDREGFGEYIVGRRCDGEHYQIHVMCLSEALNTKMSDRVSKTASPFLNGLGLVTTKTFRITAKMSKNYGSP